MKEVINAFTAQFDYPADARRALAEGYEHLCADPEASALFHSYVDAYERDEFRDYGGALTALERLDCGVHAYTLHLLLFICFSRRLHERYREAGIDEQIWFDSMCDLKWKLRECWRMYGIWGSFVARWFPGFFTMSRFALGRFQYETIRMGETYTYGGKTVGAEDTVLNFHIPSCGPITPERRMDSYRRAEAFYRDLFPDGITVLTCHSWLLFPAHREMLPPDSNIVGFMNDFQLLHAEEDPGYHDFWRVFYRAYSPDMPAETTLQRAYLARRNSGLPGGAGRGVILLQNGEILNR